MPPHNLGEVVDGICAVIDSPHMTVDELRQFIKGPDFPTGGDIPGFSGIDNYFRTGRGSVRIRGKIDIEQTDSGKDLLIIREVPYGVNRAALQERIAELYKDKILTDISGIRDLSDEKTCIEIELKRDARPQVVMNQLYKLTSMETSFSVNMLAIHDNRPKTLAMLDATTSTLSTGARWSCAARATCWATPRRTPNGWKPSCWPWATWTTSSASSATPKTGRKPVNASRHIPSPRRRRKASAS